MRQNLHLYIGDMEVEFNQPPDILYTFQTTELTNPTVIKNSFSKQITIYGSPQNNNIFGQYWNVERLQGTSNGIGAYFNPSKKVPFTLYINGDIYESGYVKLDEVKIVEGKSVEYNITLYGGLGQFFYNLSTDWNTGNKRTLADLNYYKWSEDTEPLDLSFTINKETVASAWTAINSNDVYSVINFAPVYNGVPDKIDADKVVMNFNNLSGFTSASTKDGTTYTISNGYALATLPQKLMAEEVRDYRSYLQTPIIRVSSIIDAICRKENNSGLYDNGYEVVLDNDFFNTTNPYYWDSWMTLPLLTNLEFTSSGGVPTAWTGNYTTTEIYDSGGLNKGYIYTFPLESAITSGNTQVRMSFDMAVIVTGDVRSNLYIYGRGAYGLQLYASNSVSQSENVLAGSRIKWLTGNNKYDYSEATSSGQFTPKYQSGVDSIIGRFQNIPNSIQYKFAGTTNGTGRVELICDLPVGSTCFKLMLVKTNASTNRWDRNRVTTQEGSRYGEVRDIFQFLPFKTLPSDDKVIVLQESDDGSSYSNRYISKEMLLGTDFSPCDFLLSYCKQFGLYIYKDRVEDKIYIKTRKNFYNRDNVIDIDEKIDRLNDVNVKPLNIDYGFFALTNSGETSSFYNDYMNKYGKVYGQKIIATGYDFNADTKNLIDSVFKGAVQAKEMSQYFFKPSTDKVHPYMFNGAKYTLYENGDGEGSTTDINVNYKLISDTFEPYDSEFAGYDYVSKPQFYDSSKKPLNTEYVMLFFNGYQSIPVSYNWNLTDDIGAMYRLNNNPCWLLTTTSADTGGNTIALPITQFPRFSRWYEGNKWMTYSWDFGSPREIYVPDMTNNDEGNIYWNYFKTYYEDSYDVNSKIVEAYVINKDFSQEDLRNFYWFDNSLWVLNKIEDYNVTSFEGTKCEFVKVQDVNNYTNEDATTELWIKVTLDKYVLPASGGTIVGTVRTSDNYGWNVENISISPTGDSGYTVTIDPESYGSSGNFFITASTNDSEEKEVTIYVTAGDIGGSVTFVQDGAYLRLIPSGVTFTSTGGTAVINVESNIGWMVKLESEKELTGITINNLSVSDVPYSGGTVTSADCTYTVIGSYDNGTTGDVTSLATVSGSVTISASTIEERHSAGTITLSATYSGYSASASATVYQSAAPSLKDVPLTFEVEEGGTIYWKTTNNSWNKSISYSINGGNWSSIIPTTSGAPISVNAGDTVQLKGNNSAYSNGSNHTYFSVSTNTKFNVKGNIMSLINADNFSGLTSVSSYCFEQLFVGCTGVYRAEELLLPATSLTSYCYQLMFQGCSELITAPALPATTLAPYCYCAMFQDCSRLNNAPDLFATILESGCYYAMFFNCSLLNHIKCLATNISATNCTKSWVSGVAGTGTFIKNVDMSSWTRGNDGIPSGWAVQNTATGSSIIVSTISGGSISVGQGCEVGFGNGYFIVDGMSACTLSDGINTVIINGTAGYGWSNISYDDASAVQFSYDWGGSSHQYTGLCYLTVQVTDGNNTVTGVLQDNWGVSSIDLDLTPFWSNDTVVHNLTTTISLTIN